ADDPMLESYVLDSTATRHDLDSLAARYLGAPIRRREDLCGKGAKEISFDQVDLDAAGPYAAERADAALRLHATLGARLAAHGELARVYEEIERPLVPVLHKMEQAGVRVDAEMLRRQSQELAAEMARIEQEAYAAAGGPF